MNRVKNMRTKLLFVLLAVCNVYSASAALSGTYTINPGGTATASNYLTLTSAISDLTAGTRADGGPANGSGVTGAVVLELATGYTSGGETFPLTFGAITGTSATNTITVRPAAGVGSALTITSANATATVDLNGCNYVIFDGRNGGSGTNRYLNIANTNVAGAAVRYINDARNGTIRYCGLVGVNTSATGGVVVFSTANSIGNNTNTIDNCDIKDGATTPTNGIYSAGTLALDNTGNTISNCNISNFFNAGTATNGILISSNSTTWSITNNRIFQSTGRTYTTAAQHNGINILAGNGYTVSNNTIGYSASTNSGTYTMSGSVASTFRGINLTVGTTTASSVQGNTITAISLTTTSTTGTLAGALCGISVNGGNVNIGTTSGNTIGASSGTAAMTLAAGSAGAIIGINASTTGTLNIQNNTIGALSNVAATASNTQSLHGIYVGAAATLLTISNNTIGNATPNNMVAGSSGVTTGGTLVSGIASISTATALVYSNNTIQNFASYGTSSSAYVRGIQTTTSATTGSVLISNNTIANLTTAGTFTSYSSGQSLATGIHFAAGLNAVISGNTIYNISGTNTGTGNYAVTGISLASAVSTRVTKNIIYGLSNAGTGTTATAPPVIAGILVRSHTTSDTLDNNMISLGNGQATNTAILGLFFNHGSSPNPVNIVYHNTVNIEGTVTSGALSTFCLNRGDLTTTSRTMTMDVRNNIFINSRTGGTGKHYAISNNFGNATSSATGWGTNASNYNLLNTANTATLGFWTSDRDFANWKSNSASDANSFSGYTTTFVNSASNLHLNMGTTANVMESGGTTITGFNTDIDGDARPGPTGSLNGGASAPDLGADEFDGVILDITAPVITYTLLSNTASTANRTTSSFATITDNYSGVNTTSGTRPRLYFKKSTDANAFAGNTSGNNGWKWVQANNTSSPFDFTIDYSIINGGSVTAGDVIQYFVVAQDQASTPNISSNPSAGFVGTTVSSITSAPTTPNSYVVAAAITSPVNVGTGQTYTSLTNAGGLFEAINNGVLAGNTVANVTSDLTESGTNALNVQGLNGYSLTIQPSTNTLRVIENSALLSTSMIRLNGVANVTIDGRSGGSGQYFRIINTHTTAASCQPAIEILNSATATTIRNCILESNTSASGTLFIGTGTNTVSVIANDIRDAVGIPGTAGVPLAGIYSNSATNSLVIGGNAAADGNNVYNFTNVGIGLVAVGNGAVVKNNNVYQTAARSTATYPIYINTGDDHVVSNNNIYQTTGTLTAQIGGIIVQGGGNGFVISNNNIGGSNASRSGTAMTVDAGVTTYGIFCNAGTGTAASITGNTFSNFANITTAASGVVIGINATGNVDIKNNILGGGANPWDTIMNAYDNGIILYSGTNTANIEGNIVGNIAYYRNSGDRTAGIAVTGAGTVSIKKNTIRDIKANATSTTTTAFSAWGIYIGAAISGSSVIDSNTIYNIENTSTGASAYPTAGIRVNTAPAAGATFSRNRIYNIKTNSTGTGSSAGIVAGISLITSSNACNFYNNQIVIGTGASSEAIAYGIYDGGTGGSNFHYNAIAVTGSMSGTNKSFAYFRNTTPTPSIKNNIFYNDRTGSTGGQFAIGTASTTNWTSAVSNNNLFVVSNLSNMGEWATGTPQTLAQWQTSSSGDANSTVQTTATLPLSTFFTTPASADMSVTSGNLSYVAGNGTPVTVTTDYTGATRSTTTPTVGSVEVPVPTITVVPSNVSVCSGAATSFSVTASGSLISGYVWQVDNGGGFANISNGGVYTNATTATLNISSSTGLGGYLYRALAINPSGASAPSASATLTINPPPAITTNPANATPCPGSSTSFTVAASNTPTSYVWQVDNGGGFANISNGGIYSNATTATLNISSSTGLSGYQYRAIATNACGSSSPSTAATLTFSPVPSITTDPSNATVCSGAATSFTVAASASPTGYVWQVDNGGGYANISNGGAYSNATTATLNISSTTGFNGYLYRAIAINACGNSTPSAAATLNLNFVPSITTNPSNATLCSGAATSFTVAASNTPTSYVWQVDNGGGYANISNGGVYSNATTATLNISSTTGLNGYLYRALAINGCGVSSSASTAATLTLNFTPAITTNPAGVSVCPGASTSFTVAASNTPTGYVWQVDNGGGYANISNGGVYSNATTATLNISSTTGLAGFSYKALAINGCGTSSASTAATITFNTVPSVTTNPSATTTVCAGSNATITVTASGTGIGYQWQSSTNGGGTWANLTNTAPYSNVTTASMDITAATAGLNNNQYRCVVTGTCSPAATSTASVLTVNDLPAITTNPAATTTVCQNTNTSFTVAATGTGIAYQWQVSTNGGGTWANLTNTAPYSNVATATLNVTSAPLSLNNNQYRAVVTGTCSPAVNSTAGVLQINASPVITTHPTNASTCPNGNASFTVAATGAGLNYQWQLSINSGTTWANIANGAPYSNVTTSTLSIVNAALSMDAYQYRCYITGTCAPAVTSNAGVLTLNNVITITSQPPVSQVVCTGSNITIPVGITGASTFQWYADFGSGFTAISNNATYSGATTPTLSITNAGNAVTGTYRCIVGSACTAPFATNTSVLNVYAPVVINTHPASTSVCEGVNGYFSVTATGGGVVSYQWQVSSNSGGTWANISNNSTYSGVTNNQLTINPLIALNNNQYRCVVTSSCQVPVNSNVATLTVAQSIVVNTQPVTSQFACLGNPAIISVTASNATSYQWQADYGSGYVNVTNVAPYSGATTATLNISSAVAGNAGTYRCVMGNGICANLTSGLSVLNVYAPAAITTQPASASYCVGTNGTFTVSASGGGTLLYQWQLSTNSGGTWANLTNSAPHSTVNSATLNITGFTIGMNGNQYRCVVTGNCAPAAVTNAVVLTVNPFILITSQPPTSQFVCTGSNITIPVGITGATSFQWYGDFGAGFVALTNTGAYSGVNTATLTLTNVSAVNTGSYRCVVGGPCNPPFATNTSVLNVYLPTTITAQPASATNCVNSTSYFTVAATGSILTYQWQLSTNGGTTWGNLTNVAPYSGVLSNQLTITNTGTALNAFQYRCIVSGACASTVVSNAAVLTVTPLVTISTQPVVSQFVCAGSAASMTCVAANATAFQWQLDQGSGFVNVPNSAPYSGVATATLSISSASAATNGTYRCICSNACSSVPTNSSVLNVYLVTTITTQPTSLTNCSGVNSYFTVNANGSNLTYQWQLSTNGGTTWGNLSNSATYGGVTANQLTIFNTPASLNTYQYRCIVTGSCASIATSNAAILTVNTPPVVTANPVNVITCLGTNASYSVAATGSSISYKWQVYNNITWTNVVDNAIYSNSATATLTLTGVTATMNGYAYRCVVTGICPNNPATSNQASLTVNMPPAITVNPVNQVICLGTNTSYSVSATGTAPITYQWQADQGSGFVNISNGTNYIGVTTNTLNVNFAPLTFNGYKYRCAVNGLCAPPANSGFGTITINDTATVVSVPFTDTLCEGDSSLFAVNLGGPVTSLQWQESDGLGGFNDLPTGTPPYIGVNGPVLRINPANVSLYGKQYRCKVSSSCNVVYSNVFTLITYKVPNFILDPIDATVPQEKDATFIVDGSDTGYIYYWQASSDNGNNFSNIYNNNMYSGVQTKTLTVIKVNPAENGWLFRCIVKDNKGYCYKQYDTSYAAKLTVGPLTPFPVNVATTAAGNVKFSVYPNPVHGSELMIKVNSAAIKTAHYRIVDQFGRTLQDETVTLSTLNTAPVNVASLVSGVYTIQFVDAQNNINQSIRFTKQE